MVQAGVPSIGAILRGDREKLLRFNAEEHPVAEGVFPSPFVYGEQALLCVPTDVPAPNCQVTLRCVGCGRIARYVAGAA